MVDACVCLHMQVSKMSHRIGAAAGYIQLAIESGVCVCEGETEKTDVRDKRLPVLSVTPSLFTAFTSLSPLFPSSVSFLQHPAPSLYLLRRDLVSPWPVGTEKQP